MTVSYSGPDRRRFARLQYALQVKYRVKTLGGQFQAVEVADISVEGMKLFFTGHLKENDPVELEVTLAGSTMPFKLTASLKWISELPVLGKYPGGVQFTGLTPDQTARLERFIAKHLPPE
ncbi:MAG TPA: PilZ domain-containing protein [bacterium]|nr:PilZ domain-containing protein [bacterium]